KSKFGFLLLSEENGIVSRLEIDRETGNFYIRDRMSSHKFELPDSFVLENLHQFRFLKLNEKISLHLEEIDLGEISVSEKKIKIGFSCTNSALALEMVRLTVL